VTTLMLDVDGVLVHPAHPGGWAQRLETDLGLSRIDLDRAFFIPHWEEISLGRADLHERLAPVLAEIAPHLTADQLTQYWFANDARLDEVLLGELERLRACGVAMHLATVQEHHRAHYLWENLGFRRRFDAMHYAADLGSAKPDPAFFRAIETRTGLSSADLVLIDDRISNVESARDCGWRAVLWDTSSQLNHVLAEQGVRRA
jgi:putative hydrolase of the HAD superfamily